MNAINAILAFLGAGISLVALIHHLVNGDPPLAKNNLTWTALKKSEGKFKELLRNSSDAEIKECFSLLLEHAIAIRPHRVGSLPEMKRFLSSQNLAIEVLADRFSHSGDVASLSTTRDIQNIIDKQIEILSQKGIISWFKGQADPELADQYEQNEARKKELFGSIS